MATGSWHRVEGSNPKPSLHRGQRAAQPSAGPVATARRQTTLFRDDPCVPPAPYSTSGCVAKCAPLQASQRPGPARLRCCCRCRWAAPREGLAGGRGPAWPAGVWADRVRRRGWVAQGVAEQSAAVVQPPRAGWGGGAQAALRPWHTCYREASCAQALPRRACARCSTHRSYPHQPTHPPARPVNHLRKLCLLG